MSFVKTYYFQFRVPTTPGGHTYSWKAGANWSLGVPIGNYGSPYVGAAIAGSPYHTGEVTLDDYGSGTIVSLYGLNINVGAVLELAPGSELAINHTTVDGGGHTVIASGLMINQGTMILDSGSAFEVKSLESGTGNFGTFDFNGINADIYITNPAGESSLAHVVNFAPTDSLILEGAHVHQGYTAWSALDVSGSLEVFGTHDNTGTLVYQIDHFSTAAATTSLDVVQLTSGTDLIGNSLVDSLELVAVCFAAGTRIETDRGAIPIENLNPGDLVRTVARGDSALKPVRWIGERTVTFGNGTDDEALYPVRIRAGALAEGVPERDLLVSGNHCLLLEGQLIPAKLLINGSSVLMDRTAPSVRYLHIELDEHDAVMAEGVPAETYMDVGNRAFFSNAAVTTLSPALPAAEDMAPWQDRLCAPLRLRAQEVDTAWQVIADRAAALGQSRPQPALTREPDTRIIAGSRTLHPTERNSRATIFVLPVAGAELRIQSRSTVPADLDRHTNDWRRLGLGVSKIVLRSGAHQSVIPADHPSLTRGWHDVEGDGSTCWRWTAGDAVLTVPLSMQSGPLTIELHTVGAMQYALDPEPEQRAA